MMEIWNLRLSADGAGHLGIPLVDLPHNDWSRNDQGTLFFWLPLLAAFVSAVGLYTYTAAQQLP